MSTKYSPYAFGSDFAALEVATRFASVKRWHTIETTRSQSLAEHSANVALLVYIITAHAPHMYFGDPLSMAGLALIHDAPEVFTGDLPTHTKELLGKASVDLMERTLTPVCYFRHMTDTDKMLIKICDLADAIRFINLNGVDKAARHAQRGVESSYASTLTKASLVWPPEIYKDVLETTWIYAFETRNKDAPLSNIGDVWKVVEDMARRSGNQSGSSGLVILNERRKL